MNIDDATLRALGRELPVVTPGPDARARLIAAARATPMARPRGRAAWAWAAAAATLVVVGAPLARERAGGAMEDARPATVRVLAGAASERRREVVGGRTREVLRVEDATVHLEVPPVEGRWVVIESGDAEVGCASGALVALVTRGRLERLEMISGEARVTRGAGPPRVVSAGEVMAWPAAARGGAEGADVDPRAARSAQVDGPRATEEAAAHTRRQRDAVDARPQRDAADARPQRDAVDVAPGADGAEPPPARAAAATAGPRPSAPAGTAMRTPVGALTARDREAPGGPRLDPAPADGAAERVASASVATTSAAIDATPRGPRAPVPPAPWDAISPQATEAELDQALEARFVEGWRQLKKGANEAAALAFGDVVAQGGAREIAEEAAYHQVLALVRARALGQAEVVVRRQLARWPTGRRTGASALLLGEQLDPRAARPWLERAARDADPAIRARAEEALDRL